MVLKRKQSAHSVCIIPKKTNVPKRPPTKADLVEEIKVMKQINDAMEEDIKTSDDEIALLKKKEITYLATIKKLEETVKNLQSASMSKSSKHSTLAQTEASAGPDDPLLIQCHLCVHVVI